MILVEAMPIPMAAPVDKLRPPARAVILDLSVASTVTLPPLMERFLASVPPAMSTVDLPLLTTTLTAPAMEAAPPLPDTEPARDWAASLPWKSPSMFWVSLLVTVTSSFSEDSRSPLTFTPALLLFTLTATPMAMALDFSARLMAAPVPMVLKLPVFSEVVSIFLFATILPTSVLASWLAMVRPTAAATSTFCFSCFLFTPRVEPT